MNPFLPRATAILLAVASALALAPPAAAIPCPHATLEADYICVEQRVDVPNGLPTQLDPAISAVEHRYYVYLGIKDCTTSVTGYACTGQGQGPGTVTNTIGIVYYESNTFGGLQREQFWAAGHVNPLPADTILLI